MVVMYNDHTYVEDKLIFQVELMRLPLDYHNDFNTQTIGLVNVGVFNQEKKLGFGFMGAQGGDDIEAPGQLKFRISPFKMIAGEHLCIKCMRTINDDNEDFYGNIMVTFNVCF